MLPKSGLRLGSKTKAQADVTTTSYNDEGFAKAIESFVLPSVG